jgi:lipopolysaccharide/colanic/teichoic acid biosynthesis glycosyltransferase
MSRRLQREHRCVQGGCGVAEIEEHRVKRAFDFILASLALVISTPLWALFALAIKLDDGGPVLYRQRRWGRNKSPILILKFRTMVVDAEHRFEARQAEENDARVTRVGRFLRSTSLDEMPQILSIWKGEMSWVGPRALRINELQINETNGHVPDEQIPGFDLRCRVRPGLTGLAQIYAPRDVPRSHKFRYDALYIRKRSFWLDSKLITLSVWITMRAKWESRHDKVPRRRTQARRDGAESEYGVTGRA